MTSFEARVPMRDGVSLATDIYLPEGPGPWPALLQRTPYGKDLPLIVSLSFDPMQAVARGYAVIVQDCRGCGRSDGAFHALVDERRDGHDAIAWLAAQPWCDGRVGVYGSSYMGVTALQATIDAPAALRASMAYITGASYHDGWAYSGGAFELGFGLRWAFDQALRAVDRHEPRRAGEIRDLVDRFRSDRLAYFNSSFDLRSMAGAAEPPHWGEWLDHPRYDDHWASLDVIAAAARGGIRVPLLQIAGWYDPFASSQLALHAALAGESRIVVGPWDHNAYMSAQTATAAGARDFGAGAAGGREGVGPLVLRWFDRWFGKQAGEALPPVRYFAIGPDAWRDSESWPPQHRLQRWHLHRDGLLSTSEPGDEEADSFRYDPAMPAPTLGGRHLLSFLPSGVQDHSPLAGRDDVLAYISPVLAEPVKIAGPVRFDVHFRSTAQQADIVAILVDILPSGEAHNIVEGILRSGPADGSLTVEMGDISYELASGHRIGLYVTSSSFPRFDRVALPATQQVLHGRLHPSAVVLPIEVPEG